MKRLLSIALLAATLGLAAWNISLEAQINSLRDGQLTIAKTEDEIAAVLEKHNKGLSDLAEASQANSRSIVLTSDSLVSLTHALAGGK